MDTDKDGMLSDEEYIDGCTKLSRHSLESLGLGHENLEDCFKEEVKSVHRNHEGKMTYTDLKKFTISHWFEQQELNKKRGHPITFEAWLMTVTRSVENLKVLAVAGVASEINSPETRRRALPPSKQTSPLTTPP